MKNLKSLFARVVNIKNSLACFLLLAFATPSFAEGSADVWSAIDLSGTAAKVTAAGVVVIGIAMALKSISLGKRTVNKA